MKKYFLLIAGEYHYPCSGTSDWRGTFETNEEAEVAAKDKRCDWHYIVDLREWIGGTDDDQYDPEMYR